MKVIVEEFQYHSNRAKEIISKVFPLEEEGVMQLPLVGYYYSSQLKDTLFFLPKVVINAEDKLLGKYDPEEIIDFSEAYQNGEISKDDYDFIYGLSVWIYRAINVYRQDSLANKSKEIPSIVYSRKVVSLGITGEVVYNSFLDVMLSLIRFNRENKNYFSFIIHNIHSGVNHINWTRTVNHSHPFVQDGVPIYMDLVNKKKQINYDEELFIIFFSILQHLESCYGFPVEIDYGYELLTEDEMKNYLSGYGTLRLEQIRYRYFSDKEVLLWNLCYDFFSMVQNANAVDAEDDYLLVRNFNIVFEAMVDKLLSDKNDSRIKDLGLQEQPDGKVVDHIYAYRGLIFNEDKQEPADIYYIGDSKYYKQGNELSTNSIFKQYTYARNVIQANLNLFNSDDEQHSGAGKKYLIYRDEITEGYNITPNFFIRSHIEDKDYDNDNLRRLKDSNGVDVKMDINCHFKNRLFDRDTLLLEHFSINFLFVLAVYGSDNVAQQEEFKQKAHKLFRENIIGEIEDKYSFFSLQMKPDLKLSRHGDEDDEFDKDELNQLIEQTYFHKLLGRAFRPFNSEKFLYLSLKNDEIYFNENMKLLGNLSNDFYIREYKLGTNPSDELNHYVQLMNTPSTTGYTRIYNFADFNNDTFLLGGYRTDKKQKEWIDRKKLYNIRADVRRRGGTTIDERATTVRFLLLYNIDFPEEYTAYEIDSWKVRDEDWMNANEYDSPTGPYIVYKLKRQVIFEKGLLAAMLRYGATKAICEDAKDKQSDWRNSVWIGSPIFLKGKEIAESCLPNHIERGKAILVVAINDKNLSHMSIGYSAGMFVTPDTEKIVKIFSSTQYVIYSNKQNHKIFKIASEPQITDEVPIGYTQHRIGRMLKEGNIPLSKQSQKDPDFFLSFKLEETSMKLDQKKINAIPSGYSGYDTRIIEI